MIRRFLIYYPGSETTDVQEVFVKPHETPEQAIRREGDAKEKWILLKDLAEE